MKKFFAHFMRIIRKFWFFLLIIAPISPIFFFGVLIIMTVISMLFFSDPIDVESVVEDVLSNFTEEELEIIFSEEVDENVSDEEYLTLAARYQCYICPKKLDKLTTWVGSENYKDSYVYQYDVNDKNIEFHDTDKQKELIKNSINKNNVQTLRLISSGKDVIFRYTYRNAGTVEDVVFTHEELENL